MPSATATRTAMDFLSKVFGEDCINGMASYEGEWAQKLENLETELKKMRTLKADADSAREKLEQQFDTFKSRASSLKQEAERRLKERAKEITELNEDLKEKDQQLNDKDQELKQTNLRLDEAKGQVEELSQTRTDLERQLLETQERPRNDLLSDISKSFGQECSIYQVLSTLSWEDLNVAGNCCLYVLPKIKPKGGAGVGMNLQYGIEIGRRFLEPIYELDIPKRQDLLNAAADHMSQIDPKYVFQNVERGLFNSDLHQGKPTRQGQRIRRMESFLVLNSSNKNVVAKAAVILED
jgi:exonuclease VII large subunit